LIRTWEVRFATAIFGQVNVRFRPGSHSPHLIDEEAESILEISGKKGIPNSNCRATVTRAEPPGAMQGVCVITSIATLVDCRVAASTSAAVLPRASARAPSLEAPSREMTTL
jgi:hypothetical protein